MVNMWRALCGMRWGIQTEIDESLVIAEMGTTTLSSSLLASSIGLGMKCSLIESSTGGAGLGFVGGLCCCICSSTGFKCGDRWSGAGWMVRPGILLRVMRLCSRGAILTTLGAVGLLDSIGTNFGEWVSSSSTLGGCCS